MTIVVTLRHIPLYCVHRTIAVGSTMIASYIHDTHTHSVGTEMQKADARLDH